MRYRVHAYVQLENQSHELMIWLRYPEDMINVAFEAFHENLKKATVKLNTELQNVTFSDILKTLEAYNTVYYLQKRMLDLLIIQAYIKAYHEQQYIKHIKLTCGKHELITVIDIHPFFQKKVC